MDLVKQIYSAFCGASIINFHHLLRAKQLIELEAARKGRKTYHVEVGFSAMAQNGEFEGLVEASRASSYGKSKMVTIER